MSATDPTATEILAAMSTPADESQAGLTRRRFLKAVGAGVAVSALPAWLGEEAAAAAPLGPNDGVLVVVLLGGGNDGLSTVVPTEDGAYRSARRNLAIDPRTTLPIGRGFGLHPALKEVKRRFDAKQVAVIHGVGDAKPDLSHFTAMARWMGGDGSSTPTSGWLGRFADGLPGADAFASCTIGTSVPLMLVGRQRTGTALPMDLDAGLSTTHKDDWVRRSAECVREMGAAPGGLGHWGDALARTGRTALDLNGRVAPVYGTERSNQKLTAAMEIAARLINADLGMRVVQVSHGSYDFHSDIPWQQNQRMEQLDAALAAFFATLAPRFQRRTTVLTVSEFGRRVQANQSNGTDHGTASALFAIGAGVVGGHHGQPPSLSALDRDGNVVPTVDYRAVYSTVLETWLRGDPRQVLGGTFENLRFLRAPAA